MPLPVPAAPRPAYFAVSTRKFVVMNACTFGLYQFFWFYKTWQSVRERDKSDIWPMWRTLFVYFFCYSLFAKIRATAQQNNVEVSFPAGPLAAAWIIVSLLAELPGPFLLVSLLGFFLILPVLSAVGLINDKLAPGHDRNDRFSTTNVVTLVIGSAVSVLVIVGLFLPGQ